MPLFAKLRTLLPNRSISLKIAIQRTKLHFSTTPDVVYAIGDVHGCLPLLKRLEDIIQEDAEAETGEKALVRLGDYVDRGPDSAAVLDHLTSPSNFSFQTLNLAGNHEEMMLDFLVRPHPQHQWLQFGGRETLSSYGIYKIPSSLRELETTLKAHVPDEHLTFLGELPSMIRFPEVCLVHGGIDPQSTLDDQIDEVLLWKRPSPRIENLPFLLVYGHTPVARLEIKGSCINVDTGAYATGMLSAVKICKQGEISFFSCN